MNTESSDAPRNHRPASIMVRLMLEKYDELVEVDYVHGRARNLYHMEGKYFVPIPDMSIRDIRRYTAESMVHPDDLERYLRVSDPATANERMKKQRVRRERFRFKLLNGDWSWVEQVAVSGEENGVPEGYCYVFLFDIQEQVDRENGTKGAGGENALCSTRGELTGLLHEADFYRRGQRLAEEHPEGWCLLAMDLEHFKLFNEWYGRKHGDFLLAQIGTRLGAVERETGGAACHFGQDDFCILMPYDKERIERLYGDIHKLIVEYGTSVGFLPAFGVCMTDGHSTVYELYDHAAMAARRAKDNYQNRIRLFDPVMYEKTDQDYRILSDFQKGMEQHEMTFYLQPQCRVDDGRIVGAESLVRWQRADGEMMKPDIFVPVLERYGFVTDLDKYVWEEVCAWQKRWIDSGHMPLPVSVNVSQIDIYSIDVPDFFGRLIEKYALPTDAIKIEITESAYVDNDSVAETVRRLREKGFMVLMDDFGSGYSSLNMLRNLSVDIIKLDAHFLRMNRDDRKGAQIMESIVAMAKTMGVPIIVEGVETEEETDFLRSMGCRYVQGFYFHRPMPPEEFEKLAAKPENIDLNGFRFRSKDQFRIREFLDQNLISDTVLNNILGPVAFFLWHGDDLDIVRYNQQFSQEIKVPHFRRYMKATEKRLVAEDVPKLYELLRQAMNDPLFGARGVLRVALNDGSVAQFRMHFFFLDEDESGKRFYGSVHDITKFITLNDHMRLLSLLAPDTVVFLRKCSGELEFQAAAHGLENELGLDRVALERELDEGRFRERLDPNEREALLQQIVASGMRMKEFSAPFRVVAADGRTVWLRMRFDAVHDRTSGVEYLMILRDAED